ncbi:unnamed protein product [Prorocentrum cordatum]|uniref:Uncharacterized protein n=1 Tax=Prorocentrum cordatum TaxID=2364126 RepID=A0ABN9VX24_9DINO|nr:unnamed protein product [Polarella glacialis]
MNCQSASRISWICAGAPGAVRRWSSAGPGNFRGAPKVYACAAVSSSIIGKPIVFLGVNRLLTWVMILILVLFLFMGVVVLSGWRLNSKMGLGLGALYVGYVLFGLHQSSAGHKIH